MLKLEQNPKLGYYLVGAEKIFSKPMALIEATDTGHFPQWNFSNDIFGKLDWTVNPHVDLRLIYKMRAQQLREKYDWIRVEASGGGDSTTAIFSFLLNDIHLDEVIFRYPKTGEKNVTDDPFNTKCENTLSEWQYAAQPLLQWISTHYPQVKCTLHDYSSNMLDEENSIEETWVFKSKDYFQPGHAAKHTNFGTDEQKHLADKGLKMCVLYGIDKPKLCIKDNKWYLYFLDLQANHANPEIGDYDIVNEYFYWTPDLPEIVLKQAHIIRDWFMQPQNQHLQYLVRWPNHSIAHRTAYESMVKPLIYPDYNPNTFQTAKPTNSFYNEMDHWFYTNFQQTRLYQVWQAGLQLLVGSIDPKFFNYELGKPVGFVGFLSPFYCLGAATVSVDQYQIDITIPNRF